MARKLPNYFQSVAASFLLISLSIGILPITLFATLSALAYGALTSSLITSKTSKADRKEKIVLITGARANKALTFIRSFKKANYRVIAAEEEDWGTFACARFSLAVDKFYTLPSIASHSAYIEAIKYIVQTEGVTIWVPCSSVQSTLVDAEAAQQIRELHLGKGTDGFCKSFIQNPDIAATLHCKDKFEILLNQLGLPIPHSKVVTDNARALDFLYSPEAQKDQARYILKCMTLDDLGRDDFTLLPLETREETRTHLKNMPTPISKEVPFMVQRFLKGREYCTHVAVREGKLVAFVACRSNPLLMRYVDVRGLGGDEAKRSVELKLWVEAFLQKWASKLKSDGKVGWEAELTGHFSFDFIFDEEEAKWYALECNVVSSSWHLSCKQLSSPSLGAGQRPHTAVTLFSETNTLIDSYIGKSGVEGQIPLSIPPTVTRPRSWFAHALPVAIIRYFFRLPFLRYIPESLLSVINPGLPKLVWKSGNQDDPTLSPGPSQSPLAVLWNFAKGTFFSWWFDWNSSGGEKDAYWEWNDPIPFFVVVHVTWVWIFLGLAFGGKGWKAVNVSTERVFAC
ncbi:hypothetical protein NLI96_g1358 [Meripilus lineatus]|uniref:ATP-grasp domain-containing protein n=1 Tax=Meripilus lineatus TaxID=2056292 RepID=A0AAD5VCR7_9APHY|nr:hypothetical protein NLI96_g1358 [Physisporinus lineatus]